MEKNQSALNNFIQHFLIQQHQDTQHESLKLSWREHVCNLSDLNDPLIKPNVNLSNYWRMSRKELNTRSVSVLKLVVIGQATGLLS